MVSEENKLTHLLNLGYEYGVRHFNAEKSGTLLQIIRESIPNLTDIFIQEIVDLGSAYVDHKRVQDIHFSVSANAYIRVHTTPRRYVNIKRTHFSQIIIFNNEDFVVVNKPAGIPVHATVDNAKENLITQMGQHFKTEFMITNRLDIPTQGLMVLAKNLEFQRKFNLLLSEGKVEKIYQAQVHGENVRIGQWTHFMEPSEKSPKKVSSQKSPGSKECRLKVLSAKTIKSNISEVEIELETGRTHQIRAQFSAEGHPLVGDTVYGAPSVDRDREWIALRCQKLSFPEGFNFEISE